MTRATKIDLYQLTSLVPHHAAGRTDDRVEMTFFSRRLPRNPTTKETVRAALLWVGLPAVLEHLSRARFEERDLEGLLAHPILGPALGAHPELVERLRAWRFEGTVRAAPNGTLLTARTAQREDGSPLSIGGVHPSAGTPYLVVETDLLGAKLIETPLLSIINHSTMVASKAVRVVESARRLHPDRAVLEFGSRRTHSEAAVDAALAAYLAGAAATSNVEAHLRHGVPLAGTMDHFAVQAWERADQPRHTTEEAYFRAFHDLYPGRDTLLVDTYDTFGSQSGIRSAVRATGNGPYGIRIDSQLSAPNIHRARALLNELGAHHTKIFVSGGMDEHSIAELGDAPVDGYGVGERIVTSPDAPVGVGAVAKISKINGEPSMKLAVGSGKASLPGSLQVWRQGERDLVGLVGEQQEGQALLSQVWQSGEPIPPPAHSSTRERVRQELDGVDILGDQPIRDVVVSNALAATVTGLVERYQ